MIKRLRIKFVCINMAAVLVMLTAILCLLYQTTAADLEKDSLAVLHSAAAGQMRPGRPGNDMAPQLTFILQEEKNGTIRVLGGAFFDLSDEAMVLDIYSQAQNSGRETGQIPQYALRYYAAGGALGSRYVFMDISAELAALRSLLVTCVVIWIVGAVIFFGISILLARWAIHPVEKAWDQQRQFVADASHELKTPLTVILTNAQMLQAPEYTREQKLQFQHNILEVSLQMRDLVESLLQLARGDRGMQKTEKAELELSALAENALLTFEPMYFERQILLESDIEPGIRVAGDSASLRQMVNILLDNGQKYAAAGETAHFRLSRQGKKAVLRFFTPGASMTAQQCRDIFKRFYRLDEARTSSGSYGLGLSIAESVAHSHGGRIWAEPAQGGNVFIVTLPTI